MSDDEVEADGMRNALSAIANEIQKFHTKNVTTDERDNAELLNELIKFKCAINARNLQITHLRSNLKTACAVAKAMSSAKATEIVSLRKHLDNVRNLYLELEEQQNEKNQLISNLTKENHTLRDQLECFSNAIQLCYRQLNGIRNEDVENVSTLKQLNDIIVCCGQYHGDQYSEHETCIRLQQKNKFLNTKMIIMENNLEAARDELRHLRTCIKPYKEKRDALMRPQHSIDSLCSDYKLDSHQHDFTKLTMTKIELTRCSSLANLRDLELTTHLKTVNKLLNDHDILIKDLQSLTSIINNKNT